MNAQAIIEQFRRLWTSLSAVQRISIGIAAMAVVAGLVVFSRSRTEGDFRPLFTGMNAEDAGQIVQKLKEGGSEYRVGDNGATVLVPAAKVAETRLAMASAGLPRSGRIGFELFDKTNLGATDFAEQVNFRRALEGELERSIRAVAEVESARVHLTFAKDSVFLESRTPAKASVLLKLREGVRITPANVTAVSHLIASAVDNLTPEDVSVMDVHGNLLSRPKSNGDIGQPSDELIEYRQKLERDLLAKANSTLEPLLGPGKYRIGLSIDCDFSTGEQSDELYDPEKSVMTSSQKLEETNAAAGSGGVPGVASNLPRPPARSTGSSGTVTRRSENIAYQSSRTVRRVKLPQGSVRRISASLLLDQPSTWQRINGQYQRVFAPPAPETVRAIRELVAGAIGLVPSRGDQLVVESLPFEVNLQPPPAEPKQAPAGVPAQKEAPKPEWALDWKIAAAVAGGVFLLAAGWFAFRRLRKRKKKSPAVTVSQAPALPEAPQNLALPEAEATARVEATQGSATNLLQQAQERVIQTAKIEQLVEQIRKSIGDDPALAASVLRSWVEEIER